MKIANPYGFEFLKIDKTKISNILTVMSRFGYKRKIVAISSFIFIGALHLPFVFAKNRPSNSINAENRILATPPADSVSTATTSNSLLSIYDSLKLDAMGLSRQVFEYAINGLNYMVERGKVLNSNIISIADFSKPSFKKRLYVIDLVNCKLLFNTYVAHGVNSGREFANRFSNVPESNQSSPGFYTTLSTYNGSNGYSLKLDGLEKGINDNANERAIVMHGADYVSEAFIRSQGFIGRSFGCPSVPQKLSKPIIDKIKNGTCLFIYSPDKTYASRSKVLNHSVSIAKI